MCEDRSTEYLREATEFRDAHRPDWGSATPADYSGSVPSSTRKFAAGDGVGVDEGPGEGDGVGGGG